MELMVLGKVGTHHPPTLEWHLACTSDCFLLLFFSSSRLSGDAGGLTKVLVLLP